MRKLTIALLAGATRICCSQFGWSVMTAVDAIAPVAAAA